MYKLLSDRIIFDLHKINMKYIVIFTCVIYTLSVKSQTSSAIEVYRIFQAKCISCHDKAQKTAGLDLQGAGPTESIRAQEVWTNLIRVSPQNPRAKSKGHSLIYPGRPDKSFLFRKINKGLEPTIQLEPSEEAEMPKDNSITLTNSEKELVRQWILYGAPVSGIPVNKSTVEQFYNSGGLRSFTSPPSPPDPSEGFQIKMGPFFLSPGGEIEYFQKWELDLPDNLEVNKMDFKFGNYSHHFLIYQFENSATSIPDGLRLDPNHSNIKLVAAVQEPTELILPNNTAFFWNKAAVMDLNSHYINYSATLPLQAEVYVNVYTQAKGSAKHEMKSVLVPNFNISIPNNGKLHTFEAPFIAQQQVYVWGMMGHTHKYGKDYKVYKRLPNGIKGELIYNASCFQGNPTCSSPFFDYRHIPFRTWEPLMPLPLNPGIIHQAQFVNDGPVPVGFGATSKDEMMLIILFYTEDSTGIATAVGDQTILKNTLAITPNPCSQEFSLIVPYQFVDPLLELVDITGRIVVQKYLDPGTNTIYSGNLNNGIYISRITDRAGRFQWTRLCISHSD